MEWTLALAGVLPVLVGWRWHYLVHRGRARRVERALELVSGEGSREEVLRLLSGDRELEPLKVRVQRLMGLQDFMRQRIEHEEVSLRTVLASMGDGVLVVDERQVIRLANPAFLKMFERSAACEGRSVLEVVGEPQVYRLLQEVMEHGEGRQERVEMVPGKGARHLLVQSVPMRGEGGQPGVLAVFRDVTRLEELEKVRREFVANVSHELRTPLAIFQGYVENLIEMPDLLEGDRLQILEILRRNSLRLNALVEDLLALARLEAGREEFRWEEADLGGSVARWVGDWSVRAKGRGVSVGVECGEGLPLVRMDVLRIEQVLHNLLENALKHSPATGGRIEVRVNREGDWVRVSVEDNGSGISAVHLPHIFERFYRGDKARTSGGEVHGTGLGLSIVKHIVVRHAGEVGAASPGGRGAQVWFRLPVVAG